MNFQYEINFNRDSKWHMHSDHFHEGYEVLLSLSNAGSFFVENNLYPLRRGTLLVIKNTALHHSIADPQVVYERYVLHFTEETLSAISTAQTNLLLRFNKANHCIQLDENELLLLTSLFEKCYKPQSSNFGDDLKRDILFIELLLKICTFLEDKDYINTFTTNNFIRIIPILDYIKCNIDKNLSLDIIANHFFMSKYHLCHIFKEATGFTVVDYIIKYRIFKARELLRKGYSVQAAGEMAGFRNYAHFIRTFGNVSGISPGRYKKKYERKN
ncbi:AraC family transcriptional regulator [Maledivibacter halophilus]|uniref:AraC-type DNA-binding protein n=1 Tax=Maledivibacter halophilus TaxID=36842 RepID=A0A1T5L453_9FIRM|nr:AraC family transcriptional regulator [Maledivibacter halophilus]SKC70409.1 AraC-type DNA-binding protein [Maledivibacter halophilus]